MKINSIEDLPQHHREQAREVLSERQARTAARRQLDQAVNESLVRLFLAHWRRLGGPPLHREWQFHLERKWRFDFVFPEQKIAIEIEGGTRQRGRHNRAQGYANDCEKYNAAVTLGWRVFRFSDVMLKGKRVDEFIQVAIDAIEEAHHATN